MLKRNSLKTKFLTRVLLVVLIISILTGIFQIYVLNQQLKEEINRQTSLVSKHIEQSIQATNLASKSIEHQIDSKIAAQLRHIGLSFEGRTAESITNEELKELKQKFNLEGLTLFVKEGDDVVAVKATDPNEIGFSFKKYAVQSLPQIIELIEGKTPDLGGMAYTEPNIVILPITQSGSHESQQAFFKYAYYQPQGTNFLINPYVPANQVYQYTKAVGPDKQIKEIIRESENIKEIAVLNPQVYADPSLETKFFPPKSKVEYGFFKLQAKEDIKSLKQMAEDLRVYSYISTGIEGKVQKIFVPLNEEQVVYIGLDYDRMTKPLYRQAIILIILSLVAVAMVALLTVKFFNKIYERIQIIKKQVKKLEDGDFTIKSDVKDGTELQALSESANRMVETLQYTLKDTSNKAEDVQRLSDRLEEEASNSVEKIFTISTEATIKSREQLYDIISFLDSLEAYIKKQEDETSREILKEIEFMRQVANERTADTTEMTISLSDLIQSLHQQSTELSNIASKLSQSMNQFKL